MPHRPGRVPPGNLRRSLISANLLFKLRDSLAELVNLLVLIGEDYRLSGSQRATTGISEDRGNTGLMVIARSAQTQCHGALVHLVLISKKEPVRLTASG
jgi:hypothetical protein